MGLNDGWVLVPAGTAVIVLAWWSGRRLAGRWAVDRDITQLVHQDPAARVLAFTRLVPQRHDPTVDRVLGLRVETETDDAARAGYEHAQGPRTIASSRSGHQARTQKLGIVLADAALIAGLIILTWKIGVRSTDLIGQPKGGDALEHVAWTRTMMLQFPHVLWNPYWYGGMPSLISTYPLLYNMMIAGIVTVGGLSIQRAMVGAAAVAYFIMVASLYGFVRVIAKSRLAAAIAGLVLLGVPALWQPTLQFGEYPRFTGMALGCTATWLAASHAMKPTRTRFCASVLVIGVAFATHFATAAIGGLQVVAVLACVPTLPIRDRLRRAGIAAIAIGGVAAWVLLPSLIGVRAYYIVPQTVLLRGPPTPWRDLVYPGGRPLDLRAFSPVLLPLAFLLLGSVLFLIRRPARPFWEAPSAAWAERRAHFAPTLGATVAMLIIVACCLAYVFVGNVTNLKLNLHGVYPPDMLSYAAWPMAAVIGVLLGALLRQPRTHGRATWQLPVVAGTVAASVASLVVVTPLLAQGAFSYDALANATAPVLPSATVPPQFRVAIADGIETGWINALTSIPEINGPASQEELNIDNTAWVQNEIGNPTSLPVAQFVAQWNALRWIQAGGQSDDTLYRHNPDIYRLLGSSKDTSYRTYEVRDPRPVLEATNAPPALVIGYSAPRQLKYDLVYRSLALVDDGPDQVIPIEGKAYIDDYTLRELEQFPILVLYGFETHDTAKAARLLNAYVRAGGGVVADVAGEPELATRLAALGAPLPVASWAPTELAGSWDFTATSASPFTRGIDVTKFAPALFAHTQPYLVDVAQRTASSAQVVLASAGRPVVIAGRFGAGTVVESGLNLPYHDMVNSNTTEASLLARLIDLARDQAWTSNRAKYSNVVMTGDSDGLDVESAKGVLFRATDSPDWNVSVDGRPVTAYPAGPDYIYVPLGATTGGRHVAFRYRPSRSEWAAIAITTGTVLVLALYLFDVPVAPIDRWRRVLRDRVRYLTVRRSTPREPVAGHGWRSGESTS